MKRFTIKCEGRELIDETEYRYTKNDIGRTVIIKHSDVRTKTKTETYKVFDLHNNLIEDNHIRGNRLVYHKLSTYKYDDNNNCVSVKSRFTGYRLFEKERFATREIEYN